MNHLIHEKSPYLLQHANNPVDWYPWGTEAFERAEREDKPVFLSIGYSTCHWCHVMAHESFEDGETAAVLNRYFICIKVDREERPEVDAVYMAVCQAWTGSGGWPLTVILAPDQRPVFAGTYFPKHAKYGQPGLIDVLCEIKRLWKERREELLSAGDQIVKAISERQVLRGKTAGPKLVERTADYLKQEYDSRYGGFSGAPKFPVPHNLFFLLRYAALKKDTGALAMVEHTLRAMADGGIFDHIGGGFSRYSTDAMWLIPHFEKMLYDNALLAVAYLEAFQVTQNEFYADVAERTLNYVLRELTGPEGEFFCGQDADSEGVEGKYYSFTPEEIRLALSGQKGETDMSCGAEEFCLAYNITDSGNFEGKSIPSRIGQKGPLPKGIGAVRKKLYEYRKARTSLHLDDKAILSWNAWAIIAMCRASRILEEPKYLDAALNAHRFIKNRMTDDSQRLYLRYREGEAAFSGHLDDYAVYGLALYELYETLYDPRYLEEAVLRAGQMMELFEDRECGGYFLTASDATPLIVRPKETYDGALPSGNSAAAVLLAKLAHATGEAVWQEAAFRQNRFLTGEMGDFPYGHSFGMLAVISEIYPSRELVCVTADRELPKPLKEYLKTHLPVNLTVLLKNRENQAALSNAAPFTGDYPVPEEGCMYYLCSNGNCALPTKDFGGLKL